MRCAAARDERGGVGGRWRDGELAGSSEPVGVGSVARGGVRGARWRRLGWARWASESAGDAAVTGDGVLARGGADSGKSVSVSRETFVCERERCTVIDAVSSEGAHGGRARGAWGAFRVKRPLGRRAHLQKSAFDEDGGGRGRSANGSECGGPRAMWRAAAMARCRAAV